MDRRTVFAIVIVGAIILLTPYYYALISPPPEETPAIASPGESPHSAEQPAAPPAESRLWETEQPARSSVGAGQQVSEQAWYSPDPISEARTVEVNTPLYRATFSTRGATVQSWIILPTQPYLDKQEQLIRPAYADRNLILTARGGLGLLRTAEKNFEVDRASIRLGPSDRAEALTFTLPLPEGGYYREIYTFYPDRYEVDLKLESRGITRLTGAATAWFSWGGGLASTEADTAQEHYYTEAMYYMGRSLETLKSKGTKVAEEEATGPATWVAQRTKYFLAALIPESPAVGARLATWPDSLYQGKYRPKLYETSLSLSLSESGDLDNKLKLYLGPLDYDAVRNVDKTLEETMSWGWKIVEPFSKGVFWSLVFIHRFIPNYGIVLIIFAVIVKLIVWPLTFKSHQSMKRMQMLQPKMKELQAKHKENPQKMQQEVMALYKQYKVNPMGGCWPVLIQMPLFYALFNVFRSTIELRGQPFMLWINDLSLPDVLFTLPFAIPLYGAHVAVLPIVMAISTYLQSKTTMTDPNQKMMLYMMPVMFIFLFNNFPSGLTLYYTLFNLLSWAQQRLMKVHDPGLEKLVEETEKEREREAQREERRARKKNRSAN